MIDTGITYYSDSSILSSITKYIFNSVIHIICILRNIISCIISPLITAGTQDATHLLAVMDLDVCGIWV